MVKEQGYKLPEDFVANTKDPLLDFNVNDSTELLLVQWPKNQTPDYDGKGLSLKLCRNGKMGSVEGASGREFVLMSSAVQESNATVFISSSSETKIAGKISRRVSLVHYPEPSELLERQELHMAKFRKKNQISSSMAYSSQKTPSRSTRTTTTATPTRSTFQRGSQPINGRAASAHSSEHKSSLSEAGEPSQRGSKRHVSPGGSHSGVTSSGQGRSTTTTSSGETSSKKHKR